MHNTEIHKRIYSYSYDSSDELGMDCTCDDENNYAILKIEENITNGLVNFHFECKEENNLFNKEYQCIQSVLTSGIPIEFAINATFDDLIQLLRRWCLEGPYPTEETVFTCYSRRKKVSISNTVQIDNYNWKQLALVMKTYLLHNDLEKPLVQMSPMYRYYGDLYPDNGRDDNMVSANGVYIGVQL